MIGGLYAKDARLYPQRRGQLLVIFKQLGRYFEICFSNSREDGLETRQWSIMWLFRRTGEMWLRPELNSEGNGEEMIDSR